MSTTTTERRPRGRTPATNARLDDIREMVALGENGLGVARRLGLTTGSLYKFLRNHGERDLARQLQGEGQGKLRAGVIR